MSNPYNVKVVTPPATEVITLAEVKTHLKVDYSDDDDLISGLIFSAHEWAETFTRRKFITQTLRLYLDNFYNWYGVDNSLPTPWYSFITLPYGQTTAVNNIKYIDTNGTLQTLSTSIYITDFVSDPAKIYHAYNQAFPIVQQIPQAVQIEYVTGWADAVSVPYSIKSAMKLYISHLYENRGESNVECPDAIEDLLYPYRIMDV